MFPDVNGGISYLTLKTRSGCETKRNIVIHEEETIKKHNDVSFVIRFHGDCAIGTFHIQRGSLSTMRSGCDLRTIVYEIKE
jgi:hypothetical protein